MMRESNFYLMALCSALFTLPAQADHALAMHGAPKYPADFQHFAYTNPDAPKGGTLRLGLTGAFDSTNPFALRGRAAYGVNPASGQLYLYDSLLARSQDEPFTLYGLIADDVSTPDDRSTVRFHLNPAARFHDGHPITSADVRFSWDTLRQHGRPNHRNYYNKVERVETPDAHSIVFTFKPNADGKLDRELPLLLGLMPIIPQHIWRDIDMTAPSLTPLVGSGPYRIQALEAGRSITWERVADYWAQNLPSQRGLYNFSTIKIDYYRDEQVALQAFKSGQYDLRRENDPARWATAYSGSALDSGQYQLLTLPHGRVEAVRAYAFNLRRPLFHDPVLRQAIHDALDFNWLNRVLFHRAYTHTTSYYPNSPLAATGLPDAAEQTLLAPWHDQLPTALFTTPLPDETAPDLRTIQHHLQQGGYDLQDGQLFTPQHQPVQFTLVLNDPSEEKSAAQLTRNLRQLGMEVRLQLLDSAQFQVRQSSFDFDMMLVRWVNSLSPGNEQAIYWGSAAADQQGSRNYAGIKQPAIDALIQRITTAKTRDELVNATHALDRVLLWGFYSVPLFYQPADHWAVAKHLVPPPITPSNGAMLESWWDLAAKP